MKIMFSLSNPFFSEIFLIKLPKINVGILPDASSPIINPYSPFSILLLIFSIIFLIGSSNSATSSSSIPFLGFVSTFGNVSFILFCSYYYHKLSQYFCLIKLARNFANRSSIYRLKLLGQFSGNNNGSLSQFAEFFEFSQRFQYSVFRLIEYSSFFDITNFFEKHLATFFVRRETQKNKFIRRESANT